MHVKTAFALFCGSAMLLATNTFAQITPGLVEWRYGGRNVEWPDWAPGTVEERIVPAPYAANAWGSDTTGFDVNYTVPGYWPPEWPGYNRAINGGWGNDMTFRYFGYINIPEGSNTVTFASSFDDGKRLYIDDISVMYNKEWNWTASATLTLSTGWHKFELRIDNGDGGFGPPGGDSLWHPDRIGFGIDWNGGPASNPGNFVFPVNTAEHTIFSTTAPLDRVVVGMSDAIQIGSTMATIPCTLQINASNPGSLRVYYGILDGGATAGQWAHETPPMAVTDSGDFALSLAGLLFNTDYYFRAAFISNSGVTNFASQTFTFKTGVTVLASPAYRDSGAMFFTANLPVAPPESGVLCVFYDTSDKSANNDWALRADYTGAISAGDHEMTVATLAADQTYWYRYAFISDIGSHTNYSANVFSVLNADVNIPCDFAWRELNNADIALENPRAWRNLANLPHTIPGTIVGDTISMRDGSNRGRTFWLNADASLAAIYVGHNDWHDGNWHTFTTSTASTLNLQTTNPAEPFLLDYLCFGGVTFANNLRLQIPQPALFRKSEAHETHLVFAGPVSGNPGTLTFDSAYNDYSKFFVYMQNAASDFTGDIHLIARAGGQVRFYCGYDRWGDKVYADDAFLGNPANAVFFETPNTSFTIYKNNNIGKPREFILNRTFHGIGQIKCVEMDGWHNAWNDWPHPLDIGPNAKFYPGTPDAAGTLELWTNDLTIDPGATFAVRVSPTPNVSDSMLFSLRTTSNNNNVNSSGATLNLAGRVVLTPFDPGAAIHSGTTWTIATIVPAATTINGALTSATPHYRIHPPVLNADASGWNIIAEKLSEGSLLMLR